VERQLGEVKKFKDLEHKQIPQAFDFDLVPSLRTEARQKLSKVRPSTLGQASRISGVSPADISVLMVWLRRGAPNNVPFDSKTACSERSSERNAGENGRVDSTDAPRSDGPVTRQTN
jgi:hypothetical protein